MHTEECPHCQTETWAAEYIDHVIRFVCDECGFEWTDTFL